MATEDAFNSTFVVLVKAKNISGTPAETGSDLRGSTIGVLYYEAITIDG
jgi:hypothetical protein